PGMLPGPASPRLCDGADADPRLVASPAVLRWVAAQGVVAAGFARPEVLRVRGDGLGLRLSDAASGLTPFTGDYLYVSPLDGSAVLTSYETGRRYRITALSGAMEVTGAEALGAAERGVRMGADGLPWELAIEELASEGEGYRGATTFETVVAEREAEFDA